jgi:dienelactone hydrolase
MHLILKKLISVRDAAKMNPSSFWRFIMGTLALVVLILVEAFFLIRSLATRKLYRPEKNVIRIAEFVLLAILLLTGVFEWGFRYTGIALVLLIQAILAAISLKRGKEKPYKAFGVIRSFLLTAILYTGVLAIAILCPQYTQPATSGAYDVDTAKYTWVDESRTEAYADSGEHRALTVEFFYPVNATEKCPLVVFSHGAFGFSGSNRSTFEELASNGYVVASIGHTYQAFFTMDTDGRLTTVNTEFLNTAMALQNGDTNADEFEITHAWLDLRTADENFVLDTILKEAGKTGSDRLFAMIDPEHIGLFGHSLGGASSAEVGRLRQDIDAVIVLDGTMIGEEVSEEGGKTIFNDTPYPVPLLDIYAEDHYKNAKTALGDNYANFHADQNAVNATEVVIKNAGHLNFTDLPLFSPTLAKMLGVGSVDARTCIDTTNRLILQYFNCYLKGMETPRFEKEY